MSVLFLFFYIYVARSVKGLFRDSAGQSEMVSLPFGVVTVGNGVQQKVSALKFGTYFLGRLVLYLMELMEIIRSRTMKVLVDNRRSVIDAVCVLESTLLE